MKISFKNIFYIFSLAVLASSVFFCAPAFAQDEAPLLPVEESVDLTLDVLTPEPLVNEADVDSPLEPVLESEPLNTPVEVSVPATPVETSFSVYPVYPTGPRVIGKGPTGIPVPLASSTLSRQAAPTPEQAVLGEKILLLDTLIKETQKGNKSSKVVDLQNELKSLGFFPKNIASTGWYGPLTEAAVKKYLASKSGALKQVLGVKIVDIDDLIAKVHAGERSDNVKKLQNGLKDMGFFPKTIPSTAWYGPITKTAVEKYLGA